MAIGLVHAGEQARIFQSHRCVARNGLQQLRVFAGEGSCPVGKTEHSDEISGRGEQTDEGTVLPSKSGS